MENNFVLFKNIFTGKQSAHGLHEYPPFDEKNIKQKGKNWTINEPVTYKHYEDHLNGGLGLGVIPLSEEGKLRFFVIDLDCYDDSLNKAMVEKIYRNKLPFLPFRSKSGGLHLYIFFNDFVDYAKTKELVKEFIPVLNLSKKVEFFPKQGKEKEGVGSWINLPYYAYKDTKQYLIDKNFKPVVFEKAILTIIENQITLDNFSFLIDNLKLSDAPPCIQTIYFNGKTEDRNEYLFNVAVYAKARYGEDFINEVIEINNGFENPLEEKEIRDTMAKSHVKKDYTYKCSSYPCNEFCNKEICEKRHYGISSDEISEITFEDLIQFNSDPPFYHWMINGITMEFFSETELSKQDKFRDLCFRHLHFFPNKVKDKTWVKILNRAGKNMIIKEIDPADDMSPGGLLLAYLYDFLENRTKAQTKAQILIDRVYRDEETRMYIFKAKNLIDFLFNQKKFTSFKTTEIQSRIKRYGGLSDRVYIDKDNRSVRVWKLPFSVIEELKVNITSGLDINFDQFIEGRSLDEKENLY